MGEKVLADDTAELKLYLQVDGLHATVGYVESGEDVALAENLDIRSLSTEVAGGFVGCCCGIYAVSAEENTDRRICFTRLSYKGKR